MIVSKPKATNIEKSKRLFVIQGWILDGVADRLIVKQIMQQWDLKVRQAERYVEYAYNDWAKIKNVEIEIKRELAIARLKQKSRSLKSEFKGTPSGIAIELAIEKEINKIEALYPTTKIILQGDKDNPLIVNNPEDRDVRIAELLAKAQKSI